MTRYRVEFWLDAGKDDELLLLETIDDLKKRRSFVTTIRDGIRLIMDLRAGNLDVLFELFPWTRSRLDSIPGGGGDGDIERQFDELKRFIVEQGGIAAPPAGYPLMKSAKPLAGGSFTPPLPQFEDDDFAPAVIMKKDSNMDAGQNFLAAMMGLKGNNPA